MEKKISSTLFQKKHGSGGGGCTKSETALIITR